jgi:hypothetical protein
METGGSFLKVKRPGREADRSPPISGKVKKTWLKVKRPGREADRSPSISGKVKKTWIYTSTPLYVFMA